MCIRGRGGFSLQCSASFFFALLCGGRRTGNHRRESLRHLRVHSSFGVFFSHDHEEKKREKPSPGGEEEAESFSSFSRLHNGGGKGLSKVWMRRDGVRGWIFMAEEEQLR